MDYGAINAKVGSMRGNLLKYEDFYLLCNFSKVNDMQIKLKQYSAYSKIDIYDSENFSRNRKIDFTDDFCKIIHFLNDYNTKKYLRTVLFLFEAELIKKIVQNCFNNQKFSLTKRETDFISEMDPVLNTQNLLEANTLSELIKALENSRFYYVMKDSRDRNMDCVQYGIELERYCLKEIEKAKKTNLSKEEAGIVNKINGTSYDMQNLIRLMKYKKYTGNISGDISDDTIAYSFLIPVHYKLKSNDVKSLSESKNFNELIQYVNGLYYGKYLNQPPSMAYYSAMKDVFIKLPRNNNLSGILEYLFKKYYEVKNLNIIFEGIKYHMPQEEILELLYVS